MTQRLMQWLRTVEGIQRYKRFQKDFSGTISKTTPPSPPSHSLIGERIDNYAITNLPSEIMEITMVDVVTSSKNSKETYYHRPA